MRDTVREADEHLARARELAHEGRKGEAVALLLTAAAARPGVPAATLLSEAAPLALWVYGAPRALEIARDAVAQARGAEGVAEVRAWTRYGDALLWAGQYPEALEAWRTAVAVPASEDAAVLCERSDALLRSGRLPEATDAAYRALVRARDQDEPVHLLDALGLACCAEIHSGRLREALVCAEQAVAATSDAAGLALLDALGLLAWVTALLGDAARCTTVLARCEEVAGELPMTAPGGLAAGMLALGQGRFEDAVRAFETKLREAGISPFAQACGPRPFVPALAEAYVRVDRSEDARALVDSFVDDAVETGQPRLAAPALRAAAVVRDDPSLFAAAREWHEQWGNLLEEGRTHLAEGELLRRAKRREDARRALRLALDRFVHVGAETWAQRARTELRAAGDRQVVEPTPASPVPLTQQEAAIVDLVRVGASNREVSEQLFLSVKTVEAHLTSVYQKLGVRSRSQLLALLDGRR